MPKWRVVSSEHCLSTDEEVASGKWLYKSDIWVWTSLLLETVAKTGMILLAGEITSRAAIDYQKVVRETIKHIGYDDSSKGAF